MRLGCTGWLGPVAALTIAALAVGGTVGAAVRALATPDVPLPPETSEADGTRAQQKLFELARQAHRAATTALSEAEVNALLAHHLIEARGVRLGAPFARLLGRDRIELLAQVPLRQLFEDAGVPALGDQLPAGWRMRPVWVRVGAHVRVDEGARRQLRLDVEDFTIGRQRLPSAALRLMLDPAAVGLLRWPLPRDVESVTIEPGRAIIRTAS